jgi:hypothetical protein
MARRTVVFGISVFHLYVILSCYAWVQSIERASLEVSVLYAGEEYTLRYTDSSHHLQVRTHLMSINFIT